MGTYTAADFLSTFGGLPDRGEAAIDIHDLEDRRRLEAKDEPPAPVELVSVECSYCHGGGRFVDANRKQWRCFACKGSGRLLEPKAERIGQPGEEE